MGGKTALHVCTVNSKPKPSNLKSEKAVNDDPSTISSSQDEWNAIVCAELLIQNGAKMDNADDEYPSVHVFDYAMDNDAEKEMIDFLSSKLTEAEKKTKMSRYLYESARTGNINEVAEALALG